MPQVVHNYQVSARWAGSTSAGYREYGRTHQVDVAGRVLTVSADPAFRGDATLPNPEQLLLAAAVSCQMLSFLAVAARAGVEVLGYTDDAEAVMPHDVRNPMKIRRISMRPTITFGEPVTLERVREMVAQAHRECFIANSLDTEMAIEPTVVVAGTG